MLHHVHLLQSDKRLFVDCKHQKLSPSRIIMSTRSYGRYREWLGIIQCYYCIVMSFLSLVLFTTELQVLSYFSLTPITALARDRHSFSSFLQKTELHCDKFRWLLSFVLCIFVLYTCWLCLSHRQNFLNVIFGSVIFTVTELVRYYCYYYFSTFLCVFF